MRPTLYEIDKITNKAKEYLSNHINFTDLYEAADILWAGLSPVTDDRLVVCPCTNVDHIKSKHIFHLDQDFKDTVGRTVTSTAEHTLSLILQLAKLAKIQLFGKTICIIGYGRIGKLVDNYVRALGMYVYTDIDKIHLADVITLHVPCNAETKGLIGKEQFDKMKDGALLINTSRPDIVDEDALIDALLSGQLGAYSDDFKRERRIEHFSNVIQTPHIAGSSKEAREITDMYMAKKLVSML